MECSTVVWCLPPNAIPISTKGLRVNFFVRYMATCLGKAIFGELFLAFSSSIFISNLSEMSNLFAFSSSYLRHLKLFKVISWASFISFSVKNGSRWFASEYDPIPPVFGPLSPLSRALWSCEVARGRMFLPAKVAEMAENGWEVKYTPNIKMDGNTI